MCSAFGQGGNSFTSLHDIHRCCDRKVSLLMGGSDFRII